MASKYQNAVDRATKSNEETAPTPAPIPAGAASMISVVTDKDIQALKEDSSLEFAPQLFSIQEGQMVVGILEGNGPVAEFEHREKVTGEVTVNIVNTWIIADPHSGMRISILSSAQLDRKLPPFVGGIVKIVRGKDVNTGNGQRVTEYLVAGPRLAGGERRSWAVNPTLDASATERAPQLPAGSTNHATPQASGAPAEDATA